MEHICTLEAGTKLVKHPSGNGFIAVHPDHAPRWIKFDGSVEDILAREVRHVQLNIKVTPTFRAELEALATVYGVSKTRLIELAIGRLPKAPA
jgi:hypothetical protein